MKQLLLILVAAFSYSSFAEAKDVSKLKWECHTGAEGDEGYAVKVDQKNEAHLYLTDPAGTRLLEVYTTKESIQNNLLSYTSNGFKLKISLENHLGEISIHIPNDLPINEVVLCRN